MDKQETNLDTEQGSGYLQPAVILPTTLKECTEALRAARSRKGKLMIQGGRTSTYWLNLPAGNTWGSSVELLSTVALNRIKDVNIRNLVVTAEPGVTVQHLKLVLEEQGLCLPWLQPVGSTIGGQLAWDSQLVSSPRYGRLRDYVLGMEVVLPSGDIVLLGGQTYKNVTGYDLARLMVGSQGSLGVITAATIKVLPAPRDSSSRIFWFNDLGAIGRLVKNMRSSFLIPTYLEMIDPRTWVAVRKGPDAFFTCWLKSNFKARPAKLGVLATFDGTAGLVQRSFQLLQEAAGGTSEEASTVDHREIDSWVHCRSQLPLLTQKSGMAWQNLRIAVPVGQISRLLELIWRLQEETGKVRIGVDGGLFDGRFNIILCSPAEGERQLFRVIRWIAEAILALRGSILRWEGNHFESEIGELGGTDLTQARVVMEKIKRVMDPSSVFPMPLLLQDGKRGDAANE